jgi:hypothetical protein
MSYKNIESDRLMDKVINIGVLGCANIAERSIIPSIKSLSRYFNLVGIASRSKHKAELFSQKFNCLGFANYEELLDVNNLEAVYIPLPNSLHYPWIKKALNRNLHVLVEKSLACNYNEVLELNQIAKISGLALFENFQFRFHRQLEKIQELVNDGNIGELRCIRSSFGFPPFKDSQNIRYDKSLGGGALLDAGAYPIKLSQILLGQDLTVEAANLFVDPDRGVDIWGGAYLKKKDSSLFSQIAFGFDNYYQCNVELWGSKGKIYTNRVFTAPFKFQPEILLENNTEKQILLVERDDHFYNMLKYFYSLISSKQFDYEYLQNIDQARLIEEIRLKSTH